MTAYEYARSNGQPLHVFWANPEGYEGYRLPNNDVFIFTPKKEVYTHYRNLQP